MRKRTSEGSLLLGPIFRVLFPHPPRTRHILALTLALACTPALAQAQPGDAPPAQEQEQAPEPDGPVDAQEGDAQEAQRLEDNKSAPAPKRGADALAKTDAAPSLGAPIKASLTQKIELPGDLKVGTPLTLELQITHDPKVTVMLPNETGSQRWAIVEAKQETVGAKEGEQTTTAQLRLVILRPGSTTLKPMIITLLRDDGQRHELLTEPIQAKPLTNLPLKGEAALEAPQAPVSVMVEDYRPLWGALGAGALLLTALFTFLFMRRRLRHEAPAPPEPLAHVLAMEALSELAATDMLERQEFLPFYSRQSEIVREYLGRQFHFPGMELTTREIRDKLQDQQWPKALAVEDVLSWLGHCDKVKFTEEQPTIPQAEGALRQAFSIVELTRTHQEKLAQEAAAAAAAAAAEQASTTTSKTPQIALKLDSPKASPADTAKGAARAEAEDEDEYKYEAPDEVEPTATMAEVLEDEEQEPPTQTDDEPVITEEALTSDAEAKVQLTTQGLDSWESILASAEAEEDSEAAEQDPEHPQEAP